MRAMVIVNPVAGKGRAEQALPAVREVWEQAGHELDVRPAASAADGAALAAEAADRGCAVVLALGGDGMLSDLAPALEHTDVALAPVPCGTGNDFAAHLGLPRDPREAAQALLSAEPVAVDLLEIVGAGDPPPGSPQAPRRTRCVNIAGVGFDAHVAAWLNETRPRRRVHGTAAYVWGMLATLRAFRPGTTRLTWADGSSEELETMIVAVCNAPQYGGGMRIAPMADARDGLMDVCVVGGMSRTAFVAAFPRVFRGSHVTHPRFSHRRTRRVRIDTDQPQPVLIDGDVVAQTPVELAVRPRALKVLVPGGRGGLAREGRAW